MDEREKASEDVEVRDSAAGGGEGTPGRRAAGVRLTWWKKLLLSVLVTAGFFVLLEVVLAAVGVRSAWYEDDPYVGFTSSAPLFVPADDGSGRMETAGNKLRLFNRQSFAAAKPPGTVRVFCVGGSTTYGRPYDDTTSFCGWLRELLTAADPSHEWEVVNAGGISYASYRVALLMEELVRYEPDLFVIYTGHNEFLERRTYTDIIEVPTAVRGVSALASRTRTWAAMSRLIDALEPAPEQTARTTPMLEAEVSTMLDEAVGPDEFTRDDAQREQVVRHFHFNLIRMIELARSVDAGVVLVTPEANLRNCSPFKSEHRHGLPDAEARRWDGLTEQARSAYEDGRVDDALALLEQAAAIDDRHAHLHYQIGRTLERLGRFSDAKRSYERARDEDVCTLRAVSELMAAVRSTAAQEQVPLVDFIDLVEDRSPHRIPGHELFLDHVHPTIEGHRLLALQVLATMRDHGFIRSGAELSDQAVQRIVDRVEGGIDQEAHGLALMKASKVLGWAGKLTDALRLAQRATVLAPDRVEVQYQAGLCAQLLGQNDVAVFHYRKAVELEPDAALPHGNLGVALEAAGQLPAAIAQYRRAIELGGTDKDLARNRKNLAEALVKLGYQETVQGRFGEAARALAEAAELDPSNPDTLDRLGAALLNLGNLEGAGASWQAALALDPDNASVHNHLAIAHGLAGNLEGARQHWQKALSLEPGLASRPDSAVAFLRANGRSEAADSLLAASHSG